MSDHRELLERRADRGTERGLGAVLDAAQHHHRSPDTTEPARRRNHSVLAVALASVVLFGAVVVGLARTRSTDLAVNATTAAPAGPTPWMLPVPLPPDTHLQSVRTETGFDGHPLGNIIILGDLNADGRLENGIAISWTMPDGLSSLFSFPTDRSAPFAIDAHTATYTTAEVSGDASLVEAITDAGTVRAASRGASRETLIALVAAVLQNPTVSAADLAAMVTSSVVYDGPDSSVYILISTYSLDYLADSSGDFRFQLRLTSGDFDPRSALMASPDVRIQDGRVVTTFFRDAPPTTTWQAQPGLIASLQTGPTGADQLDQIIDSLTPTTQSELDRSIASAPGNDEEILHATTTI